MDQLTQQQLDTFNADGFLVFEHFFEPAHNQRIKDDVDRMIARAQSANKGRCRSNDE